MSIKVTAEVKNNIKLKLMSLGVVPANDGFNYLVEAISYSLENMNNADFAWTKLYGIIGKARNVDSTRIERAIRHSIEQAFDSHNCELVNMFKPFMKNKDFKKVPNSTFISTIATFIEIEN